MKPAESRIGPWLVALGAALWGTESAWRIPLVKVFDPDVLVFWEHVGMLVFAIPLILPRLRELRNVSRSAIGWLVFSGVAGSAVGAVLFTLALKYAAGSESNETVINVVLNIQPLLSTLVAVVLFGDRLGRWFPLWAVLAVLAGMVLVGLAPGLEWQITPAIFYALACALAWGLSTVAGRAVMVEMSLPLAGGMRIVIGLVCMAIILVMRGLVHGDVLWPAAVSSTNILQLGLLITLSGALPLFVYFKGLSLTRASTAGYFEMMQTLAAVVITWGFFGAALAWWQVIAAIALIGAVAMVQRAQETTALAPVGAAAA